MGWSMSRQGGRTTIGTWGIAGTLYTGQNGYTYRFPPSKRLLPRYTTDANPAQRLHLFALDILMHVKIARRP
jgi:hypothetical protein